MSETALAQQGPGAQIVTVGKYPLNQILEQQLYKSAELAQVANVLFPVTALDQVQPLHKPSLSVITVNTNQTSKDTYFISGGQLGLSKHVILKMLKAAGACVRTQKLTPDTDIDRIRYTAMVWGKLPDGVMHQEQATKFWSWEKCQQDFIRKAVGKGKSKEEGQKNAQQYREFADEQTETKAILRAARAWLNLQTSYSREELAKPFLIARSVPDIDLSDPEIKRMATQRMLDSTFALYGAPAEAPMLPPVDMSAVPPEPTEEEYDSEEEAAPWETAENVTDAAYTAAPAGDDEDYVPAASGGVDMEAERQALENKVAAMAKRSSEGGIGKTIGKVLDRHNVRTWTGASLDLLTVIYDDCVAVREGRLQL